MPLPDNISKTAVVQGLLADGLMFESYLAAGQPVILKALARHWPLVQKGMQSPREAISYLKSFYSGNPVTGFTGEPEIGGRFFYNAEMTGLNFQSARVLLDEFLTQMESKLGVPQKQSYYIGSTDLDIYLPGLGETNSLPLDEPMFVDHAPIKSIWIGNRTVASAHYDMSNNIACCMVGRRRFTLFPPEQVHNLYPGPLELTPGGQVVSMVNFDSPDLDKHPNFVDALENAQIADLEPGDVLFYPAMWWHQVEALDDFNVLINYWWNTSASFMDMPMNTLLHAMLSLRDRPEHEKQAWRAMFDYYIFGPAETPSAHLPDHIQGSLAPLDYIKARRLRSYLLNRLNR
jgi:Cupin-like domain